MDASQDLISNWNFWHNFALIVAGVLLASIPMLILWNRKTTNDSISDLAKEVQELSGYHKHNKDDIQKIETEVEHLSGSVSEMSRSLASISKDISKVLLIGETFLGNIISKKDKDK